jgi:leader peptidase (prepilin peptidase)/N-methyltransferase
MGDVKLGAITGLYLGWLGWSWLFWGTFIGFAMGAVWAVALIMIKKAQRSTPIAFGPFLILGVVVSALLAI